MMNDRPPGHDWKTIVRKNGSDDFAAAFVAQPALQSSVMNAPCSGIKPIAAFFAATGAMYDSITFTHETTDGPKTYLEWEGRFLGEDVTGTTILTRDPNGLIQSVQLYQGPLHMVIRFSKALGQRLDGKVDPTLFDISG